MLPGVAARGFHATEPAFQPKEMYGLFRIFSAVLADLAGGAVVWLQVAEFAGGNAPGSVNIPLPALGSRLKEIPSSAPVVLCCASGTRSGMAKMMLKKNGYGQVFNIGKWTNLLR